MVLESSGDNGIGLDQGQPSFGDDPTSLGFDAAGRVQTASLKLSETGFTFGRVYKNGTVFNNVSWQACGPEPRLSMKWMSKGFRGVMLAEMRSTAMRFEEAAGRHLTDEEVGAFVYYSSKKFQTVSNYWKSAAILAGLMWWRGRKTFKMPMWRVPKDPSRYDYFPHRSMPLLQGRKANIAWYLQRCGLYIGLAVPVGAMLGFSSGTAKQVAGIQHDPRTQVVYKAWRREIDAERAQMRETLKQDGRAGQPGYQKRPGFPPQQQQQQRSEQTQQQQSQQQNPQGGFGDYSNASAQSDTGILTDSQTRSRDRRQQVSSQSSSDPGDQSTFAMDKVQQGTDKDQDRYSTYTSRDFSGSNDRDRYSSPQASQQSSSSSFDWNDDDASPTAGNGPPIESSSPSSSSSAWDRLRQENMRDRSNNYPQQQGQKQSSRWSSPSRSPTYPTPSSQSGASNSNTGDSFSFSSSDSEKQLAKEQAQRDFDEMIERERRGEEGGNSGGGRRW